MWAMKCAQTDIKDTGSVTGYLVIAYPKAGVCREYELFSIQDVEEYVKQNDRSMEKEGLSFYTLIESTLGVEVEEGFMKDYPPSTKMYRSVCVCESHTWTPLHAHSHQEVTYMCAPCLGRPTLVKDYIY